MFKKLFPKVNSSSSTPIVSSVEDLKKKKSFVSSSPNLSLSKRADTLNPKITINKDDIKSKNKKKGVLTMNNSVCNLDKMDSSFDPFSLPYLQRSRSISFSLKKKPSFSKILKKRSVQFNVPENKQNVTIEENSIDVSSPTKILYDDYSGLDSQKKEKKNILDESKTSDYDFDPETPEIKTNKTIEEEKNSTNSYFVYLDQNRLAYSSSNDKKKKLSDLNYEALNLSPNTFEKIDEELSLKNDSKTEYLLDCLTPLNDDLNLDFINNFIKNLFGLLQIEVVLEVDKKEKLPFVLNGIINLVKEKIKNDKLQNKILLNNIDLQKNKFSEQENLFQFYNEEIKKINDEKQKLNEKLKSCNKKLKNSDNEKEKTINNLNIQLDQKNVEVLLALDREKQLIEKILLFNPSFDQKTDLSVYVEDLFNKNETLTFENNNLKEKNNSKNNEIKIKDETIIENQITLTTFKNKLDNYVEQNLSLEENLKKIEKEKSKKQSSSNLENMNLQITCLQNESNMKNNEITILKNTLKEAQEGCNYWMNQTNDLNKQINQLNNTANHFDSINGEFNMHLQQIKKYFDDSLKIKDNFLVTFRQYTTENEKKHIDEVMDLKKEISVMLKTQKSLKVQIELMKQYVNKATQVFKLLKNHIYKLRFSKESLNKLSTDSNEINKFNSNLMKIFFQKSVQCLMPILDDESVNYYFDMYKIINNKPIFTLDELDFVEKMFSFLLESLLNLVLVYKNDNKSLNNKINLKEKKNFSFFSDQ